MAASSFKISLRLMFNGHVLQIAKIAGWAHQRPDIVAIIKQTPGNCGTHKTRSPCNKRGHFL